MCKLQCVIAHIGLLRKVVHILSYQTLNLSLVDNDMYFVLCFGLVFSLALLSLVWVVLFVCLLFGLHTPMTICYFYVLVN